jgi:hypothetical protein
MDYYKLKYRFQWWWYSDGGKTLFENVTGTLMLGIFLYTAWLAAWLLETN